MKTWETGKMGKTGETLEDWEMLGDEWLFERDQFDLRRFQWSAYRLRNEDVTASGM